MSAGGRGTVQVKFLGDTSHLEKAFGTVASGAEKTHAKVSGLGGGIATVAEGFGALEVAKAVVEDFNALDKATHNLQTAMKDAGEAAGPEFGSKLKEAQDHAEKMGFSAADTTNSIAKLREAGVSTGKAFEVQTGIMDLARAKNISYDDASKAVIMGMQGQGKALKDLNVELPAHLATQAKADAAAAALAKANDAATASFHKYTDAVKAHGEGSKQATSAHAAYVTAANKATAADDANAKAQADVSDRAHQLGDVMDILNKKVGGQAASASETLSGKLGAMKEQVIGAGAQLLTGMMPALSAVVGSLGFLTEHMNIVIPILGVMVAGFVAWKIAMGIAKVIEATTTAIEGLSVAMKFLAENPIFLVIGAIIAIVGALVLAYNKLDWFRNFCNTVFKGVGAVINDIVGIVKTVIGWFTGNGGMADATRTVGSVFGAVFGGIGAVIGGIVGIIQTVIGWLQNLFGWLTKSTNQADTLSTTVGNIQNTQGGNKNAGGRSGSGGSGFARAGGGRVQAGQAYNVGEKRAERFVPDVDGSIEPRVGQSGGGNTIHVHVATNADPYAIASTLAFAIRGGRA